MSNNIWYLNINTKIKEDNLNNWEKEQNMQKGNKINLQDGRKPVTQEIHDRGWLNSNQHDNILFKQRGQWKNEYHYIINI